jgi:hypothetical protein
MNAKGLAKQLVSVTPRTEIYVDLNGFSVGWIHTIVDRLLDMSRTRSDDEAEGHFAFEAGGLGVLFRTDAQYAKKVVAKANSLIALAAKTYNKDALYVRV